MLSSPQKLDNYGSIYSRKISLFSKDKYICLQVKASFSQNHVEIHFPHTFLGGKIPISYNYSSLQELEVERDLKTS